MSDKSLELVPDDYLTGRAVPPEMLSDLLVIAKLDARSVGRIAEHLEHLDGFADQDSIEEGVSASLQDHDEDVAGCVVRTLLNVEHEHVDRVVAIVGRWRASTEERASIFNDERFLSLERNLKTLVVPYVAVELLRKANRLLRDVGNEFRSVGFFCDMRPIFDEARERVEGFVTLANMRLLYVSQDNRRHACEIALTEEELDELIECCEKARAKLEVLKATSAQLSRRVKE